MHAAAIIAFWHTHMRGSRHECDANRRARIDIVGCIEIVRARNGAAYEGCPTNTPPRVATPMVRSSCPPFFGLSGTLKQRHCGGPTARPLSPSI